MDPSHLLIAPPTMFYPSTGHVTLLSAPGSSLPPPKTISLGTSSIGASLRQDSTVSSLGQPAGGAPSTTDTKKGKQRIFVKAKRPLLRYASSSPQSHGSANSRLQKMENPPKFPSVDAAGTHAATATHVCFNFTIADEHNKGCYRRNCKWAHLDAGALPPGTTAVNFASLRRAITGHLASSYAFTQDGDNVSS
jgi:hypothetical protein